VRGLAAAALIALACALAGPAIAAPTQPSAPTTPPPGTFRLPGVTLTVEPTQVLVNTRGQVTFSVALTRKLDRGRLELTLPAPWLQRAPADGRTRARVPVLGSASSRHVRVRRTGRVVRFSFTRGRRGDTGRYTATDRALAPGTYRASFVLRGEDGYQVASGLASIVVLGLPVRIPEP
jgi:hypothetical protein